MLERRSFLSGLATLPLIGGSIALLGRPTAADVPVSDQLRDRYIAWLANEHAMALFERDPPSRHRGDFRERSTDWHYARARTPMFWFPDAPDIEQAVAWSCPSGRAAVVLSVVGLGLA